MLTSHAFFLFAKQFLKNFFRLLQNDGVVVFLKLVPIHDSRSLEHHNFTFLHLLQPSYKDDMFACLLSFL